MFLMKQKTKNKLNLSVLIILTLVCFGHSPLLAITLQGPSGFINVPSHETVKAKEIELGAHYRIYENPITDKEYSLTNFSFAFSPIKDFEVGFAKGVNLTDTSIDPDPLVSFKVRLPSIGSQEFSQVAFGGVFDTNPNNYHTLYFSIGGFGLGWNFGGNRFSGIANYGSYDSDNNEPDSLCLLIGVNYPKRRPGERGYKGQFFVDYNGDVVSGGYRYKSHRGFWVDAAVHSTSSYEDFFDYKPFTLGMGANF